MVRNLCIQVPNRWKLRRSQIRECLGFLRPGSVENVEVLRLETTPDIGIAINFSVSLGWIFRVNQTSDVFYLIPSITLLKDLAMAAIVTSRPKFKLGASKASQMLQLLLAHLTEFPDPWSLSPPPWVSLPVPIRVVLHCRVQKRR